ncbi:unnamed protein product [Candidula unifasciata]|uniref:MOSC domain-containing protein n=1 Tax=Candidula unifasciata TaxID=100452 RepID=A0A8S4A2A1_9EUPU|nr:unnamed protein product [Candidula unifasciata]
MLQLLSDVDGTSAQLMSAVVFGAFAKLVGMAMVRRSHKSRFQQVGTVAHLYIYPVKSCGVLETPDAECTAVGLQSDGLTDRHWMVLDEHDRVISMDTEPTLTLIKPFSFNGNIRLQAPGMPSLDLPQKLDVNHSVIFYKKYYEQTIPVAHCGQEAENWITKFLKKPAKLVFSCPELGLRDVYSRLRQWDNTSRQGDVSVFAYLTSYMVITTESLRHINSQLATPVSPVNFRPNIVVENSIPFDEDCWKEMRIGDQSLFHSVEPCRRCVVTTVDPNTGEYNKEKQPLALLKSFRCRSPYGTAPIFGLYVSNDIPGHIKVGDSVYVMKD